PGADTENIYDRLYKRKERAFIKQEREIYNLSPRGFLEGNLIPLEQIINVEVLSNAKTVVIQRTEEEQRHFTSLIEQYESRPPFDVEHCKQVFRERIEWQLLYMKHQLPTEIVRRISDMRILALGYCTSEIYANIKKFSIENYKHTKQRIEELDKVRRLQAIPESISENFNFHDCKVLHLEQRENKNYVIQLDPTGGFTAYNMVTFVNANVIREETNIAGASWVYDEIYSTSKGYEVHILFHGGSLSELIVQCEDILLEII
ncbi:MAG TPA: DUF4085 domain-containing protein, partial [Candidatus Paenibacillus intestinavium]|nr:DUF4085 domain-containing protein [Candidatus Paenibacillus intestinavium]